MEVSLKIYAFGDFFNAHSIADQLNDFDKKREFHYFPTGDTIETSLKVVTGTCATTIFKRKFMSHIYEQMEHSVSIVDAITLSLSEFLHNVYDQDVKITIDLHQHQEARINPVYECSDEFVRYEKWLLHVSRKTPELLHAEEPKRTVYLPPSIRYELLGGDAFNDVGYGCIILSECCVSNEPLFSGLLKQPIYSYINSRHNAPMVPVKIATSTRLRQKYLSDTWAFVKINDKQIALVYKCQEQSIVDIHVLYHDELESSFAITLYDDGKNYDCYLDDTKSFFDHGVVRIRDVWMRCDVCFFLTPFPRESYIYRVKFSDDEHIRRLMEIIDEGYIEHSNWEDMTDEAPGLNVLRAIRTIQYEEEEIKYIIIVNNNAKITTHPVYDIEYGTFDDHIDDDKREIHQYENFLVIF